MRPYDKVELDRKCGTPVAVMLREEACRKPELWAKVDGTKMAKALREIMRAILFDVVPRLIEKRVVGDERCGQSCRDQWA